MWNIFMRIMRSTHTPWTKQTLLCRRSWFGRVVEVPKKSKVYTAFSGETCAEIGRHAAQNVNAAAMREFRLYILDLTEHCAPF